MTDSQPRSVAETTLPIGSEPSEDLSRRYEVLAESDVTDEHEQVLKHGESFAVFDRHGDIRPVGLGEEGIYHRGTRHLSGMVLRVAGQRPLLLGSTTKKDNSRLSVDLTNTDIGSGADRVAHSSVHLARTKVLWNGACHERWVLRNFAGRAIRLSVELRFTADFADIFEVRGMQRAAHGQKMASVLTSRSVLLRYEGLDGVIRRTRLTFSRAPDLLDERHAVFELDLPENRARTIDLSVTCEAGPRRKPDDATVDEALERARRHLPSVMRRSVRMTSSSELFNDWLDRSMADVAMLTSRTPEGLFPYAGVPWFSTPFGRDGLVVGLQTLWVAPQIARGVLGFLAARQADGYDVARDAQPGKILHEMRHGEMAALGEVPFECYYGSHDATPLFVMLAAEYLRQTDDADTVSRLWPNLERALAWIDTDADPDGDGFLEYARLSDTGLVQQGWKDSNDSVFHADGTLATGPIALCEVQAYAYAARVGAAEIAARLGHAERAAALSEQAAQLRQRFDDAFWDPELGTYALALDGSKRPCLVRTSNAGHALMAGIALPERAQLVADSLLSDATYCGWGVRTLAAGEARYNPMSYHNGSVWPHDNALVALGLSRYERSAGAARILESMFEASRHFELARMPELFCGFTRRPREAPTRYPVACSPQAWSAGAVFMLLQASLGLEVDAAAKQLRFRKSTLPEFLDRLDINGLRVGAASLDLVLERHAHGVGLRIVRRSGDVEVVSVK